MTSNTPRISDVIKRLQQIQEVEGDLPVHTVPYHSDLLDKPIDLESDILVVSQEDIEDLVKIKGDLARGEDERYLLIGGVNLNG